MFIQPTSTWHPRWDSDERQDWFHTMRVVTNAGPALAALNMDYDDEVTFRASRWIYEQAAVPRPPVHAHRVLHTTARSIRGSPRNLGPI